MAPTLSCPRHGPTASFLGCDHVSAAVISGSEPPAFQRLRATLDHSGTAVYCACFDCLDQFKLAPDFSIPADAKADASESPTINPICVECLKAVQSFRSDPESIPATSRNQTPVRPTQVSIAVLLLCVSLGTSIGSALVSLALASIHWVPHLPTFSSGIFIDAVMAWLTYHIWMGHSWARGTYAIVFGLSTVTAVLAPEAEIDIPRSLIDMVALYLLFSHPGRVWFAAKSPAPGTLV